GAGVALLGGDLLPDPGGVGTALFPALEDVVVFVGCDGTDLLLEVASLRRSFESQVLLLHGVAMYPECSGDLGVLHAFL
ncbi:MAG: hypothetical protein M3122_06250, partial [Actinomycetota bacterium]|nr:hypothetical protein [Actinomycetota bacterium]